jgi:hypothetical protein
MLGEDDNNVGSGTTWGQWHHMLYDVVSSRRTMALRARETARRRQRCGLENGMGSTVSQARG